MTDWRANPITGKSQFIPLLPEIKKRLALGETYKQIHKALPFLWPILSPRAMLITSIKH